MNLSFEKWEGIGNDFIVIHSNNFEPTLAQVKQLCDRHFGIGADGILVVQRDPARMIVHNADGSRPEMCGNGLRCAAASLEASSPTVLFSTDAGERLCTVQRETESQWQVSIGMGTARFNEPITFNTSGMNFKLSHVNMGNPHAVCFIENPQEAMQKWGEIISNCVPNGINVEFCRVRQLSPYVADVYVWERGVGPTLACGTGACAVAATACQQDTALLDHDLTIHLPGGNLIIRIDRTWNVTMTGPARRVFQGTVDIAGA